MIEKQDKQSAPATKMFSRQYLAPMKYYLLFAVIIQFIFAGWDVAFFSLNGYMVDKIIPQGKDANLLPITLFLLFAIFIVSFFFINLNFMMRGRLSQGLMYRIRKDLFGHLQKLSFSFFDRTTIGNLLARMTTDVKTYSATVAWPLPTLTYQFTFIIGAMIYMLYLNWKISLIVFSMLPFIVIFTMIFQKKILAASREVMGFNSKLTAAYNEGITGVRTIRSLATEKEFINKFEQMSQELFIVSKKRVVATAVFIPLTIGSTGIGMGLLLWFGTEAVLAGKMSLGILIILSVYTRFFSDNLLFFSGTLSRIQPGLASQDRLYRIFNSPTEIENSHEVQKNISISQGLDNPDLAEYGKTSHIRNIEFKNINFEYKENEPVLHDFNLKVAQGESIALAGETGAGKTTIVSLLCRFYEPISGEICINDLDYRKRSLNWLRSNLGVVLQTSYLF